MKEEQKNIVKEWKSNRIRVFLSATSYTVAIMALIGIGGYYLDQYLETFPKIFISGLVIAYPLTQYILYRKFKKK